MKWRPVAEKAQMLLCIAIALSLAWGGALVGCAVGDTTFTNVVTTGDITAGDDLTATGDLIAGTWARLTPQTAISVTMNGYITPTGTLQRLESAGNVSTVNLAGRTAGNVLYLLNTSNTTITFTDTGTLKLSGNLALGQYDTAVLYSDGTNWIELGDN